MGETAVSQGLGSLQHQGLSVMTVCQPRKKFTNVFQKSSGGIDRAEFSSARMQMQSTPASAGTMAP